MKEYVTRSPSLSIAMPLLKEIKRTGGAYRFDPTTGELRYHFGRSRRPRTQSRDTASIRGRRAVPVTAAELDAVRARASRHSRPRNLVDALERQAARQRADRRQALTQIAQLGL